MTMPIYNLQRETINKSVIIPHATKVNQQKILISSPIVPKLNILKQMLIDKYSQVNGDDEISTGKVSVIEIAKLLTKYHEYCISFQLAPYNTWYHPCLHFKCVEKSWQCKYFSLYKRKYDRVLSYEQCSQQINIENRGKKKN